MKVVANTPQEYIEQLPKERKEVIEKLRNVIIQNLPHGFVEEVNYGTIGYVIPHGIYPKGYHCDPRKPLPFINIASQKNFVALYHMGIYADEGLLNWFTQEHKKHCKYKLDMGKSCIRFRKIDDIPYELIGELCKKISVDDWVNSYEKAIRK